MEIPVDLSTVPELRPLPSGTYIIRVVGCKKKESKAGNEMLSWQANLVEPADIAQKIPTWYFNTVLTEKALFVVKGLFVAVTGGAPVGSFNTDAIVGQEVGVVVTLEENEEYGETNRIQKWIPVGETTSGLKEDKAAAEEAAAAV